MNLPKRPVLTTSGLPHFGQVSPGLLVCQLDLLRRLERLLEVFIERA